jgi:succinate-semialdehyde dehydrogenase/glutarate-semialdehyde dehydrogenase
VLELGGSDPYIILEDADIEATAKVCARARLFNAGQSCIAAKRFVIVDRVYEEFESYFLQAMKEAVFGDPLDPSVTIGPLARTDLRDELHHQVEISVEKGAEIILGGQIPEGPGAYYPPTVLRNVRKGMPAYNEELFGPVASLIRVRDEEEAIAVANDTTFGLGGAVFTRSKERGQKLAEFHLDAGFCVVNDFVKSDPRLPFGGIKESGFGRELSYYGIKEFVNIKTVVVN